MIEIREFNASRLTLFIFTCCVDIETTVNLSYLYSVILRLAQIALKLCFIFRLGMELWFESLEVDISIGDR